MSNHVHLIAAARENNLADILRDLKSHTAREMLKIARTEVESRTGWMLHIFARHASHHKKNEQYQLWTHENHAVEIFSDAVFQQKLNYIHDNPIRAGIVTHAEEYLYSSAKNYSGMADKLIEIDHWNA